MVKKATGGPGNAFCKLCLQTILPKSANLASHEKSEKHTKNSTAVDMARPIAFPKVAKSKEEEKEQDNFEIQMSVGIACSINRPFG